jgi:hypothetical protein
MHFNSPNSTEFEIGKSYLVNTFSPDDSTGDFDVIHVDWSLKRSGELRGRKLTYKKTGDKWTAENGEFIVGVLPLP